MNYVKERFESYPELPVIVGSKAILISGDTYYCAFTATSEPQSIKFAKETQCDILIIGGGGGGACSGGGGGAGGVVYKQNEKLNGAYTVTVGTGGNGGSWEKNGENGKNSSLGNFTAIGGGGGGYMDKGLDGGSGGGAGYDSTTPIDNPGGLGTINQGNNGGTTNSQNWTNVDPSLQYPGGGGGGFKGVGGDAIVKDKTHVSAGNGGIGFESDITGVSVGYAGGGAGSCRISDTDFINGTAKHGGGNGKSGKNAKGDDGKDGTGGGGGAGGEMGSGGKGGSGIVIIRWSSDQQNSTSTTKKQEIVTNYDKEACYNQDIFDLKCHRDIKIMIWILVSFSILMILVVLGFIIYSIIGGVNQITNPNSWSPISNRTR